MKKINIFLMCFIWLTACSPQIPVSSTSIPFPAITQSITPTLPSTATITPLPTPTPILKPEAVTFIYPEGETVLGRSQIEDTVNLAYQQYENWGCGNLGPVRIYASSDINWLRKKIGEEDMPYDGDFAGYAVKSGALFIYTDWVAWVQRNTLGWREGLVAHELAHICQTHLMGGKNPSLTDWRFLTEGGANALASRVVIPWLHAYDYKKYPTFEEYRSALLSTAKNYCSDKLLSLDSQDGSDAFWVNGEAAWSVLLKEDVTLWFKYYKALKTQDRETAFNNTFGLALRAFEASFNVPCADQVQPTPSINYPSSGTGIRGKIIWGSSYSNEMLNEYNLTFCLIGGDRCLGGPPLSSDGEFFMSLAPGYYRISLNLLTGGAATGWYSSRGMVKENSCGGLVQVVNDKITEIDFMIDTPIPCR